MSKGIFDDFLRQRVKSLSGKITWHFGAVRFPLPTDEYQEIPEGKIAVRWNDKSGKEMTLWRIRGELTVHSSGHSAICPNQNFKGIYPPHSIDTFYVPKNVCMKCEHYLPLNRSGKGYSVCKLKAHKNPEAEVVGEFFGNLQKATEIANDMMKGQSS